MSTTPLPRVNVLGVGVHAINMQDAVEFLLNSVQQRRKGYVCVTGVHGIMEAQHNCRFRQTLNDSLLTTPDGMPTVWVGKVRGHKTMDRVFGPDLMMNLCLESCANGLTHFLYGGAPGVAEDLKRNLEARCPGIKVVGTYTPPFRPLSIQEHLDLVRHVNELKPDIIWVGLSTPKQERFMAEYLSRLEVTLMVGVGAAFDIHAGQLRQAPRWMQRHGLEWLFRLACEPRRLWRRYCRNNPLFVLLLCAQALGLKKYRLDA